MATHSSIFAWDIPWARCLVGYSPWGCKKEEHDLVTKQHDANLNIGGGWFIGNRLNVRVQGKRLQGLN